MMFVDILGGTAKSGWGSNMLRSLKRSLRKRMLQFKLPPIAKKVKEEGLTYLSADRMLSLLNEIERVNERGVAGDFLEFGVALGGGSIIIAHHRGNRRFAGYDVFDMIPSPGANDGDDARSRYAVIKSGKSTGISGKRYYGYMPDLYLTVVDSFARHGLLVDQSDISLHRGLFEETFAPKNTDRFALVHIDCDWHDPVYFCLTNISPQLIVGGVIIVDDYNDYDGCRKAVERMLSEDSTLLLEKTQPHAVIRKI